MSSQQKPNWRIEYWRLGDRTVEEGRVSHLDVYAKTERTAKSRATRCYSDLCYSWKPWSLELRPDNDKMTAWTRISAYRQRIVVYPIQEETDEDN